MTIIGDGDRKERKEIPKMVSVAPSCGRFLFREFFFQLEMLNQPKGARFCLFDQRIIFYISVRWLFRFVRASSFQRQAKIGLIRIKTSSQNCLIVWHFKSVLDPPGSLWIEFSNVNVLQEPRERTYWNWATWNLFFKSVLIQWIKTDLKKREIGFHCHVGHDDNFK